MRNYRIIIPLIMILTLAIGCQPQSPTPVSQPTIVPFPTVTAGFSVSGELNPNQAQNQNNSPVFNPATAIAEVNQPTPRPDLSACPHSQIRKKSTTQLSIVMR